MISDRLIQFFSKQSILKKTIVLEKKEFSVINMFFNIYEDDYECCLTCNFIENCLTCSKKVVGELKLLDIFFKTT